MMLPVRKNWQYAIALYCTISWVLVPLHWLSFLVTGAPPQLDSRYEFEIRTQSSEFHMTEINWWMRVLCGWMTLLSCRSSWRSGYVRCCITNRLKVQIQPVPRSFAFLQRSVRSTAYPRNDVRMIAGVSAITSTTYFSSAYPKIRLSTVISASFVCSFHFDTLSWLHMVRRSKIRTIGVPMAFQRKFAYISSNTVVVANFRVIIMRSTWCKYRGTA